MPEQYTYRCPACGNDEHLSAWAGANVFGAIQADGSVRESGSEQWGTHEDSIECAIHLGDPLVEKFVGGTWCRWVPCDAPGCTFGQVTGRDRFGPTAPVVCRSCRGAAGAWVPVPASVAVGSTSGAQQGPGGSAA